MDDDKDEFCLAPAPPTARPSKAMSITFPAKRASEPGRAGEPRRRPRSLSGPPPPPRLRLDGRGTPINILYFIFFLGEGPVWCSCLELCVRRHRVLVLWRVLFLAWCGDIMQCSALQCGMVSRGMAPHVVWCRASYSPVYHVTSSSVPSRHLASHRSCVTSSPLTFSRAAIRPAFVSRAMPRLSSRATLVRDPRDAAGLAL